MWWEVLAWGNVDERIEYTAQVGGTYYVVVNGYSGHSTTEAYTPRVDVSGGPQYQHLHAHDAQVEVTLVNSSHTAETLS